MATQSYIRLPMHPDQGVASADVVQPAYSHFPASPPPPSTRLISYKYFCSPKGGWTMPDFRFWEMKQKWGNGSAGQGKFLGFACWWQNSKGFGLVWTTPSCLSLSLFNTPMALFWCVCSLSFSCVSFLAQTSLFISNSSQKELCNLAVLWCHQSSTIQYGGTAGSVSVQAQVGYNYSVTVRGLNYPATTLYYAIIFGSAQCPDPPVAYSRPPLRGYKILFGGQPQGEGSGL